MSVMIRGHAKSRTVKAMPAALRLSIRNGVTVVAPVVEKGAAKSALAVKNSMTGEREIFGREARRELPFYNFSISTFNPPKFGPSI